MEKININDIKDYVLSHQIRWTNHIMIRLLQRNITQKQVEVALLNGEIIEEYYDDYPYPSCLVYGITLNNRILHVVCGIGDNELWIITAYYPDNNEWNNDLKTRKENKN